MTERAVTVADPRLAEALVGLLSHDLRSPLGPLVLATSSIAEDPSAPEPLRELARFAEAQSGRLARMIDAVLWTSRTPPGPAGAEADVRGIVDEAVETFRALGGTCDVRADGGPVHAHRTALRDAVAGLIECAAGEGGTATVVVEHDGAEARIRIQGRESAACVAALAAGAPGDWRSAFALGAAAVFGAHRGGIREQEGAVVAWLPAGDA